MENENTKAEVNDTLLEIVRDMNTEGWAETLTGILFEDEEMKISGIAKRAISGAFISSITGVTASDRLARCSLLRVALH